MLLVKNIAQLHRAIQDDFYEEQYDKVPRIENAWLLIEEEKIHSFGSMKEAVPDADESLDANGGFVLPSWCDSHTHLIFAGSREREFEDRIRGLSYQEIAKKGGGILNSAKRLNELSEDELFESSSKRLEAVAKMGTGLIEIKSGYGLNVEAELKILRTAIRLKEHSDVHIKSTFLGAHAIPEKFKNDRRAYINLIINEMLPEIHKESLADYIDVFCEKVAFSPDETSEILEAGKVFGLKAKIHTNQFYSLGGIQTAIKHNAISVDHLEVINDEEISLLKNSNTLATLLPSAPFFLGDEFPPARKMIENGLRPVLASDYNPGSSPSGNMNLVISLACIKMKMTPEEAINAATYYGAKALELDHKYGSIRSGFAANLIITKTIPSLAYIPYSFGENQIDRIILKGKLI